MTRFTILILLLAVLLAPSFAQVASPSDVCQGSLLYKSPISGQYDEVPLLHTDAKIDVRGLVAAATITQQYENKTSAPIEAIYVFPLPHDAAVYDMEIRIGNRVIRSVVKERQEAKKVYEQAKSEGKRAALLEQERPNIFTASVANIMPGDRIDVRLQYVEPLKWEDGKVRLEFPMVVGPRFIPGEQAVGHSGTGWAMDTDAVPDASRITPTVRHPESRKGHDISVSVDLDAGFDVSSIKSISHEIKTTKLANGRQHVELVAGATLPNKDFILEMQQAGSTKPRTALFLSPDKQTGDTNFLLAAFPPTVEPKDRQPVEMFYMIDISGSMAGTSIEQARAALLQALDMLRPGDRFDILAFDHRIFEMSPDPLPATSGNLDQARAYVRSLQASGGTVMLPALMRLMTKPQTPGYLRNIVLLTDGDLGNEEQIFAAMKQNLGGARLFTIAIGSAPNMFLATKMAQFGRGTATHIATVNEVQTQMTKMLETISSPVLTDVSVAFEGVEVADMYPSRPPDLFIRQPLLIYGRIVKGSKGVVHLRGREGNASFDSGLPFNTAEASYHPGITTLWARQLVEEKMDQYRDAEVNAQADVKAAIIAHAIKYHLVTQFTSFVAVEEIVANTSGQLNTVGVPTELPEGMQMDKVFGAPATGTADEFFQTLGITLLIVGLGVGLILWKAGALS